MRRARSLVVALMLAAVLAPPAGAASSVTLPVDIDRAPVAPDGTTAGSITDFVLTFVDRDPAVDGISIKAGGTVSVTLPDGFVDVGGGAVNTAVLLQGWPQSPPFPFPWDTTVAGNTITATLRSDYLVGDFGPGTKQVHLILNTFRNPGPGRYDVDLAIQPDPASADTSTGTGTVHIIPEARPSVNAVSVFSGGAPPPLNNAIYQTVEPGDQALDVGLYLWDRGSFVADGIAKAFVGVDVEMTNLRHGRLASDGRTVGQVRIAAPRGADEFEIVTAGPSTFGTSAVTGFDVGILLTTFRTDPDVTGDYTITFRMNGGNTQQLFVTAQ